MVSWNLEPVLDFSCVAFEFELQGTNCILPRRSRVSSTLLQLVMKDVATYRIITMSYTIPAILEFYSSDTCYSFYSIVMVCSLSPHFCSALEED